MAEGVLFNITERIIVRLGSRAFQTIGSIWGVQDELNKLKETVAGFQAILLDAEQKQANNNEVKLWLESVEDAVYEADDVLDEFNTEVQRRQVMRDNAKLSKEVRIFFFSSNQLVTKDESLDKRYNKKIREVASRRASDITHDVGVDVSASSSSHHPSKLTYLSLRGIEDLASLPEEISNLTSLQFLQIIQCSNLASLPEGIRGLPCLNTLVIWDCPVLSERCKIETDAMPCGSKISSSTLSTLIIFINLFIFLIDCLEWLYMIFLLIIRV
ncbi:hypothetical protein DVH24_037255 [Malus domestica]|uniref:Disease resistance N-terminal domain-containing protein n=1 Tax=Malus domestica TaxID=3750 RepID=A0A498HK01_MALDO|nr:hypothetical protein DVH24_037255 [Malus domestica]